ncbi:MAG TPA: SDR family oxidoreductase [Polyangiales bacterium]|jgi:NADP-dependent 3-hydroxy acid dehydrogenase YdfG
MSRVTVITGASAGIGAAVAELLGRRGERVVLLARREAALQEVAARAGSEALPLVVDVTRRAEVEDACKRALDRFGQIDVWINNAGRGLSKNVSELTDEDIDEMITVNVKSVLYGIQAVLPHFKQRGRGQIINISSLLGRVPFAPFRSAYSASKHALNALTASLRMELIDQPDIHICSVHPGVVATDFGLNARHGGPDSRALPGAQSVEEVAAVIVDVIDHPRADSYTRPDARKMIADYFGAEDMGEVERQITMRRPR